MENDVNIIFTSHILLIEVPFTTPLHCKLSRQESHQKHVYVTNYQGPAISIAYTFGKGPVRLKDYKFDNNINFVS